MGRRKLPTDPRRKQQVKTFMKKYGRQGYAQAGSLGGRKSPTKFNSETASKAAAVGWEKRRARAAEKEQADENGKTIEGNEAAK
jgi:hypothetical protein